MFSTPERFDLREEPCYEAALEKQVLGQRHGLPTISITVGTDWPWVSVIKDHLLESEPNPLGPCSQSASIDPGLKGIDPNTCGLRESDEMKPGLSAFSFRCSRASVRSFHPYPPLTVGDCTPARTLESAGPAWRAWQRTRRVQKQILWGIFSGVPNRLDEDRAKARLECYRSRR